MILTDHNGTAPSDATPFRAHKTYVLPDALSWISLIGGMARPRVNSRSTNFWARLGQFFGRVEEIGSLSSPREQYGVESETRKPTVTPMPHKPDSIAAPWISTNGEIHYFKGKIGEYPSVRSQISERDFRELPENKNTQYKPVKTW